MTDPVEEKTVTHTPGPWYWLNGHLRAPHTDASGIDDYVLFTDVDPRTLRAEVEIYEPDARLIAAAPDLLAACIALQMEARARNCGLRIADEAIARATQPEGSK